MPIYCDQTHKQMNDEKIRTFVNVDHQIIHFTHFTHSMTAKFEIQIRSWSISSDLRKRTHMVYARLYTIHVHVWQIDHAQFVK